MKITFKIIYYHYSKKVISSKVNLYYYLISWTQTIQGNCSSASISEVLIQASALGIVRISIEVRKRSLRRESGNYQRRLFTELRLAISAVSHCSGPLFTRTSFQECYTTRQLVVAISRQSISSLETHEASFPKSIDIRTSLWYPPPSPTLPSLSDHSLPQFLSSLTEPNIFLRNLRADRTVTTEQRETIVCPRVLHGCPIIFHFKPSTGRIFERAMECRGRCTSEGHIRKQSCKWICISNGIKRPL